MNTELETRVAVLESTLQNLQFELEEEARRKKRARLIRLGLFGLVGLAYFLMLQKALSGAI